MSIPVDNNGEEHARLGKRVESAFGDSCCECTLSRRYERRVSPACAWLCKNMHRFAQVFCGSLRIPLGELARQAPRGRCLPGPSKRKTLSHDLPVDATTWAFLEREDPAARPARTAAAICMPLRESLAALSDRSSPKHGVRVFVARGRGAAVASRRPRCGTAERTWLSCS